MAAKRARTASDPVQTVLECNDLRALILSFAPMKVKLSVAARLNRAWYRCVYTSPAAWVGPISFSKAYFVPRDLGWLRTTRDAIVRMSDVTDADLIRVARCGTNRLEFHLDANLITLWGRDHRGTRTAALFENRVVAGSAFPLTNEAPLYATQLPESLTSLDMSTFYTDHGPVFARLPHLKCLKITLPDASMVRDLATLKLESLSLDCPRVLHNTYPEWSRCIPRTVTRLEISEFVEQELAHLHENVPALKHLILTKPRVDSHISVSVIAGFRALERVSLARVRLCEVDAFARMTTLRRIDLRVCYTVLEHIPYMPFIRHVVFYTRPPDFAAMERLRRVCPNAIIRFIRCDPSVEIWEDL